MDKVHCLKLLISRISGKPTSAVDGTTVCKVLDELCNCIDESETFSTNEVNTGKKWIDGKPIYRLAVDATCGTMADIINEHTPETITHFFGQALSMYGNRMFIPSCAGFDARYKIDLIQSNVDDHVELQYGEFFQADYRAYCVIEYTKKSEG